MGIFSFLKKVKPSKERLKMLQEELESGRILKPDEDIDNKKYIKESRNATE